MSEVYSIELLLDPVSEDALRADWDRLAAAGHSSMAAHRAASNRPHVTLLVRPAAEGPPPPHLFAAAARSLPISLALGEPVVFAHGERGVLARSVELTDDLRALHAAVHAAAPAGDDAPHTAPGEWTPHVTLARRLRLASLDAATALLGPLRSGQAVALRRWDAVARTVTGI